MPTATFVTRCARAVFLACVTLSGGPAAADADGPDAWRVVDVAPDDALNARMGPGTRYTVIGTFAHDARGLLQITCVPLLSGGIYYSLTQAERENLPPRWCLMQSPDFSVKGWVSQRYIEGDPGPSSRPGAEHGEAVADAVQLVQRLYRDHLQASRRPTVTSPLHPSRVRDFFAPDLAVALSGDRMQADPLFDAQDFRITELDIRPDADQAMFRGLISVTVDYRNFGRPHRARVRLRMQDGAPRIIRIEHEAWQVE